LLGVTSRQDDISRQRGVRVQRYKGEDFKYSDHSEEGEEEREKERSVLAP
jgi:hypothetical protein